MKVEYLVVHTAAGFDESRGVVVHHSAQQIRAIHMAKGWADIGYHGYIDHDGMFDDARDDNRVGAHVLGLNDRSLGVCVSGHGDHEPFNARQMTTLINVLILWADEHDLPSERVIGHREAKGIPGVPNPYKTCPGMLVNMDDIRRELKRKRGR